MNIKTIFSSLFVASALFCGSHMFGMDAIVIHNPEEYNNIDPEIAAHFPGKAQLIAELHDLMRTIEERSQMIEVGLSVAHESKKEIAQATGIGPSQENIQEINPDSPQVVQYSRIQTQLIHSLRTLINDNEVRIRRAREIQRQLNILE